MFIEPLEYYYNKFGVNTREIKKIISGLRYTAIMLENGNIGLCANIGNIVKLGIDEIEKPDLRNIESRILLTAYFGAKLNYEGEISDEGDIFDVVDFRIYERTTMIGYFKPVVKKFKEEKIPLAVFDLIEKSNELLPLEEKYEYLSSSDAIIISSTTIFNNTFLDVIGHSREGAEIFMLGPSSILHRDMLQYKNIKSIFGTRFNKFDENVLKLIQEGNGTRAFIKFGKKIRLKKI